MTVGNHLTILFLDFLYQGHKVGFYVCDEVLLDILNQPQNNIQLQRHLIIFEKRQQCLVKLFHNVFL